MKKLLLISMILGMLPMTMAAQDDDLYFVPKKKTVEKVTDKYGMPRETYYVGSNRSVDDYNRRTRTFSHYEPINNDSTVSDTISFSAEKGVYPNDSISDEDFELTKKMSRFEDYQLTDNEAFWAGYAAGRYDWGWHSPWYYSRYGWYGGWYDPWYYSRWGWYNYGYYGWYSGWYYPWRYGWYDPWYNPWYYDYYPTYIAGGGHYRSSANIGAGTIRRDGTTYGSYRRGSSNLNSSRRGELRYRTVNGNSRNGRVSRTDSRTYSNNSSSYSSSRNSGSFSSSRSSGSNSGSFSSSRSSSSSSGSFGGGSRGGGGGGGSRMGGRR